MTEIVACFCSEKHVLEYQDCTACFLKQKHATNARLGIGRIYIGAVATPMRARHNPTMDVIELECPHCGDELELDAAFAGSVCRCSTCGTLMTVPSGKGQAERVTRRDRPDAPGAPGAPGASGGRAESPSARADSPLSSSRPDSPIAPIEPGAADSTTIISPDDSRSGRADQAKGKGDDEFVTDSGKTVRFVESGVPTARKRKKVIRATVIGGFALLVLGLIGLIVLAVNLLFSEKPTDPTPPKHVGVDPSKNPITDAKPNILGVPITAEMAVVIDGTAFSQRWYSKVCEVASKHATASAATDFMFITWTDLAPKRFPGDKMDKIGEAKKAELDRFLSGVTPLNDASPVPSVQLAVDARADQILLITGRLLEEGELEKLKAEITKRVDTRFDAVLIGNHQAALQELAEKNLGVYISLPLEQLNTWYDQWKNPPAKQE